jgi:hypothetical protein
MAQKVIANCPMYAWNNKAYCGPITVGNLFAYWDINGYDDMFPGNLSSATSYEISEWMSSLEHYKDYFLPKDNFPPYTIMPDKSELPVGDEHPNNCIADFIGTGFSRYNCPGGLTLPIGLKPGIDDYVKHVAPNYKSECKEYPFDSFPWDSLVSNIDRNHPMVALVNMNADDNPYDHWTLVIGYKYIGIKKYFGCVSLQGELRWFPYTSRYEHIDVEQWRIFLIYTFNIQKSSTLTGIEKQILEDQIKLFPNPNSGNFTVVVLGGTSKISLYTAEGRIIQRIVNTDQSNYFKCSIPRSGIYYLQVYTKDEILTKKIIIQK